jgi:hypothetical protein
MRFSLHLAALLVMAPACQLVDPRSNLTGGAADGAAPLDGATGDGGDAGIDCPSLGAALCDDFDRALPIPAGDPRWDHADCNVGALSLVDGALRTQYPASSGAQQVQCVLVAKGSRALVPGLQSVAHISVEVDVNVAATGPSGGAVIAEWVIAADSPDATGLDQEILQLLVDGEGKGQLLAIFHNVNNPGAYPSFELATTVDGPSPFPLLTLDTTCHLSFAIDPLTPSGTLTATCGGVVVHAKPGDTSRAPKGIGGNVYFDLGFRNTINAKMPAHTVTYDNLVLRMTP